MFRQLAVLTVAAACSYCWSSTTYECSAVDSKASVGVDNQSVSTTSDTRAKTCYFSVGGASSKMQPPRDLAAALQGLRQGQSFKGNERALLLLLTAAAPSSSSINEMNFGNAVRSRMNDLDRCVDGFRTGRDYSTFRDTNFSCEVHRPDDRGQDYSWRVKIATSVPVLRISLRMGDQVHELFLPSSFFRR